MTSQTYDHPLPFARSAAPAASTAPSIWRRAGQSLWRGLQQIGARRAREELLRLARDHEEGRPEFAARLRATARRGWL